MSQYVSTEAMEMEQVASNLGWSEFCDWVGTLEVEAHPALHELATFGYTNDAGELLDELDDAVEASPPPSADVADVAEELADFLEGKEDAEIVVISNGMTAEDVGGDEDSEGEAGT